MLNDYLGSINSFTYNGRNSLDFGLMVESKEFVYGSAAPKVETVYVPGYGTLILNNKVDELDNEEHEDIDIKFNCHVLPEDTQDLHILARKIYSWLYGDIGFKKLQDSYEPNYYRMAYVRQAASVEDVAAALAGRITITFTARAYKRATIGERVIAITETPGKIYNMEAYTSKPIVYIYAHGDVVLYFNQRQISINDIVGTITLDSETLRAYRGDENCNNKLVSQVFPRLVPGMNTISWTGNVIRIEIIPRWVTL